jgi:hypothetical protein
MMIAYWSFVTIGSFKFNFKSDGTSLSKIEVANHGSLKSFS